MNPSLSGSKRFISSINLTFKEVVIFWANFLGKLSNVNLGCMTAPSVKLSTSVFHNLFGQATDIYDNNPSDFLIPEKFFITFFNLLLLYFHFIALLPLYCLSSLFILKLRETKGGA